jgi:hypothetical protein
MNIGKKQDARMWRRWYESGAVAQMQLHVRGCGHCNSPQRKGRRAASTFSWEGMVTCWIFLQTILCCCPASHKEIQVGRNFTPTTGQLGSLGGLFSTHPAVDRCCVRMTGQLAECDRIGDVALAQLKMCRGYWGGECTTLIVGAKVSQGLEYG